MPAPPPPELRITAAEPVHFAALGALTVAAYERLDPSIHDDGDADELADVAGRAAVVPVLVALLGGEVAGGVTYVPDAASPVSEFDDPEAAGIRHLAVAPAGQGRGTGRALVEVCVGRARSEGRRRVVLHTMAGMTAARALYDSLGFVRDPALDRWWGEVHGLGYRLELDEPALRP